MPLFEDVQIEVNRIFGKDADAVLVIPCGRGFEVMIGSDGFTITDWSDMDLIEQLFSMFQNNQLTN